MERDVLRALLAGSPFAQIVFEVAAGGELVGVAATQAAHRCGLLLVGDVLGRGIDDLVRTDFARSVHDGLRDALRVAEPVTSEDFVSLGQREVWGLTTFTPLFEAGVLTFLVASFLELDFVERTEAELAGLKTAMRALVEASSDAILVVHDDRIAHANPTAAARLCARPEDLVGRRLGEVVAPGDARVIPLPSSPGPARLVILRVKDT